MTRSRLPKFLRYLADGPRDILNGEWHSRFPAYPERRSDQGHTRFRIPSPPSILRQRESLTWRTSYDERQTVHVSAGPSSVLHVVIDPKRSFNPDPLNIR